MTIHDQDEYQQASIELLMLRTKLQQHEQYLDYHHGDDHYGVVPFLQASIDELEEQMYAYRRRMRCNA